MDTSNNTKTYELNIPAELDRLAQVLEFIDTHLEEHDCPPAIQMQIDISVEEIFVNIAHYAYPGKSGDADIRLALEKEDSGKLAMTVTFRDHGLFFDPLDHADPDITASAEERPIGGLGIMMVKKYMDNMSYEYK